MIQVLCLAFEEVTGGFLRDTLAVVTAVIFARVSWVTQWRQLPDGLARIPIPQLLFYVQGRSATIVPQSPFLGLHTESAILCGIGGCTTANRRASNGYLQHFGQIKLSRSYLSIGTH